MVINVFTLLLIISAFFLIGKIIASSEKDIFKKFLKNKKYYNLTNRYVNNFYGNIISIFGFIFLSIYIFGIDSMIFFAASTISILFGYIMHICDSQGLSIDSSIKVFLSDNIRNNKKMFFKDSILCVCAALITTGIICTKLIAPIILPESITKENKKEEQEITETFNNAIETNSEKEENFYKEIDKYFY